MKKQLTDREKEILGLFKQGLSTAEVGEKADPPLKVNAVYMAVRRIEQKGTKVPRKRQRSGRRKGSGRKPANKPAPGGENGGAPPATTKEFLKEILARLDTDIKRVESAMSNNRTELSRAEATIKNLEAEYNDLAGVREQLKAAKG